MKKLTVDEQIAVMRVLIQCLKSDDFECDSERSCVVTALAKMKSNFNGDKDD